jgi:hypothetical protein
VTEDADSPQSPDSSDALRVRRGERTVFSDSPAGVLLANFLAAMNRTGDDAEETYRRALKQLQANADLVAVEIARAENDCNKRDYPTRWALVHAAAELRDAAALPFLRNLVSRPIPPEQSRDPHSFSTVGEETILRTTAVEGVGYLAAEERREALEALFEFLKQPSLSIRRAAVQSILSAPGGGRMRRRIAALLPDEHQFLLELKSVDVRDVPQIEKPQRHLTEAGRRERTEAPPDFPGREPEAEERDQRRTRKRKEG